MTVSFMAGEVCYDILDGLLFIDGEVLDYFSPKLPRVDQVEIVGE